MLAQTPESVTPHSDRPINVYATRWSALAIAAFSFFYFIETCIRAAEKKLWYDEICTLYISRLPSFKDSWAAVLHGADYNPPLFYLIHRTNLHLFGDGPIATRLPEILAFWVLCLCLFSVVKRRAGLLGGVIAMTLPLLTGAYFYAYEARPHGLVLGFCGLAVLCWQEWEDQPGNLRWLFLFALSLEAAFFTHCYAIVAVTPFLLIEAYRTIRSRRLDWKIWAAMLVPLAIACVSFIPLLKAYGPLKKTGFNVFFPPNLAQIPIFFESLLQYSVILAIAAIGLFALDAVRDKAARGLPEARPALDPTRTDTLLALAFLGMPLYGLLMAKIVSGPYFPRYFASAVIGLSLAFGLGAGLRLRRRSAVAILALLVLMEAGVFLLLVEHRIKGVGEELYEPTVKLRLNTDPHDPLVLYPLLRSQASNSLPIVVPSVTSFLYLFHYWPEEARRLYPISDSPFSGAYVLNRAVREWCHVNFNHEDVFSNFITQHADFLVYTDTGNTFSNNGPVTAYLVDHGAELRYSKVDAYGGVLSLFHVPKK